MTKEGRALVLDKVDRRKVEKAIDLLISLLDTIDSDAELEDGGDAEAWLATTPQDDKSSGTEWLHANGNRIDTSDREAEDEHDEDGHDREEDKSDMEPSLGWTWHEAQTGAYATGWHVNQDLEDEHDGCEPEVDCAVDDMPCDDYDEGLEPEPWQWRQKERAAAAGRIIAKRTDELIINDPYGRPCRVRALK